MVLLTTSLLAQPRGAGISHRIPASSPSTFAISEMALPKPAPIDIDFGLITRRHRTPAGRDDFHLDHLGVHSQGAGARGSLLITPRSRDGRDRCSLDNAASVKLDTIIACEARSARKETTIPF